jgi:hypothetical protein
MLLSERKLHRKLETNKDVIPKKAFWSDAMALVERILANRQIFCKRYFKIVEIEIKGKADDRLAYIWM